MTLHPFLYQALAVAVGILILMIASVLCALVFVWVLSALAEDEEAQRQREWKAREERIAANREIAIEEYRKRQPAPGAYGPKGGDVA